jgi:hypothetical protein
MDQHTLQILLWTLQTIAAVIAILAGILTIVSQLRRLGPSWRAHFINWVLALGPFVAYVAGIVISNVWKTPTISVAMFTCGFILQIVGFLRDSKPVDRSAIVIFGISCCSFVLCVAFAYVAAFINQIIDLLHGELELIRGITEVLKQHG